MGARTTVDSDERLLAIVDELKRHQTVGVTELAAAVEMPKSTVHVHLSTLRDAGYVVQDDQQRYRLSLRFLDAGMAARRTRPVYDAVRGKLDDLADQTAEKVWCAVEERGEAVFIAKAVGSRAIQTNARVGQRVDLYRLAVGKAILANLPPARRAEILDGYDYPLPDVDLDRAAFEAELADVRDSGVAFGTGQFIQGVTGVGAPVTDNSGRVYGGISISGPTNRLQGDRLRGELADLVRGTTGELKINLSYQ
jgi:DNA-binding IclR family transcriptional regulator